MNLPPTVTFFFLLILFFVFPISKTWRLHASLTRGIFRNKQRLSPTSTSLFIQKDENSGKRAVNPFDMSDDELGSLKQDMTKDLFEEMSRGQSTVNVNDFVENFQEIIELGLITESVIQEVFRKNGVIPSTSVEASSQSNQMNYEQFKRCFTEINQICFDETYDQNLEEDENDNEVKSGEGGKGFGKKPPSPKNEDPFGDIPDGYSFRP